ncbi:hypothetical protein GGR54DRAFT_155856 [Hypoxylon sp. NC1633]|nr:hypothetical protein GGR54DRAFT_155856 [Hypoxylon sp. NC1633]
MAETIGLVLGGLPIAIWALEKYAEPFETFSHYGTSIETFKANLVLQEVQLKITLSNIGLGERPSREELRECFEKKFPHISHELLFMVQRMEEAIAKLLKKLEVGDSEEPNSLQERAEWNWRRVKHSFSIKKRTKIVEDLRKWNEDLRRSLETHEVPADDDSQKVQALIRRFDLKCSSSRRLLFISLHRALRAGFSCLCSPPHQVAIDLDWQTYESDTSNGYKIAISYETSSQPFHLAASWQWKKLHAIPQTLTQMTGLTPSLSTPSPPPSRVPSPQPKTPRFMSHLRGRAPSPLPTTPPTFNISTSVPTTAGTEITSICDTICKESNARALTGFLKDPDNDQGRQFSLGHNLTDPAKIIEAVCLKSILSSHEQAVQQRDQYLRLSAKQRYGIAASVSWSILHLGGTPWLGDCWDEEQTNIFLERSQEARNVLSRHPCISYAFSSPAILGGQAADEFKRLIPNPTIFALGILLIELCINKPITRIQREGSSTMSDSLLDRYQTALGELDEVYSLAGDSYGYAAERCVKCSFPGRYNDFDISQFRRQFYDAVVAPVQATYLMFPDSYIPT